MRKIFALLIAGTFATAGAAYAQSTPPGVAVPPATPGLTTGKAQLAAEARKEQRGVGKVRPAAGGDINKTPEGGAVGTDRAAVAGEARAQTRDQRRPGHAETMQGGTPK
ncbi:cell envelope biogenesis protein TolA [Variovorax ginsengisoli]|uniref:Type IV secretory pathway TrbL component n=1 Tax=Variovorax ginsengisoli TaxID=363844 RepID=A0ABT9SD14_9BURK|nr:cell envelope biogenesis protein TolA [Variovorax ginsengisoli]MDP9902229.1 type IV secretory pathway TrbL component [Variovorax ginsengisoli]